MNVQIRRFTTEHHIINLCCYLGIIIFILQSENSSIFFDNMEMKIISSKSGVSNTRHAALSKNVSDEDFY